jgi:hypothetical protein
MALVCRMKSLGMPSLSSKVLNASNGLLVNTPPKSQSMAVVVAVSVEDKMLS